MQGLRPFDSAQDRPRPRLRMVHPERFSAKGPPSVAQQTQFYPTMQQTAGERCGLVV
jgi:hypothetical protein